MTKHAFGIKVSLASRAPLPSAALALAAALLHSSSASAQAGPKPGYAADTFHVAERGSRWFVLDSLDFRGENRLAIGVAGSYGFRPLRVYRSDGELDKAVVREQWIGHVGASFVLDERVRFAADLPVQFGATGRRTFGAAPVAAPDGGAAVGDLRLSGDTRLFGRDGDCLTGGLGLQVHAPTGSRNAYSGDGQIRIRPRTQIAGAAGPLVYAANVGVQFRARQETFAESRIGHDVFAGVGAGFELLNGGLHLGAEVYGHHVLTGAPRALALEGLVGANAKFWADLRVGVAGAMGLTNGYGAASARGLFVVEWAPEPEGRPSRPAPPAPIPAPQAPQVEIPTPAVVTPPRDRDGDGVPDVTDACPELAGPPTSDLTTTGCPPAPADADHDGVLDAVDACPNEAGPVDADPAKTGCPKVFLQGTALVIAEQVKFGVGASTIPKGPEGDGVMAGVLAFLVAHPEIAKLRVEGHTDATGDAARNRKLSAQRAASVVRWLVAHGVQATRLSSAGLGPDKPLTDNGSEAGRSRNRRVEFHVE